MTMPQNERPRTDEEKAYEILPVIHVGGEEKEPEYRKISRMKISQALSDARAEEREAQIEKDARIAEDAFDNLSKPVNLRNTNYVYHEDIAEKIRAQEGK